MKLATKTPRVPLHDCLIAWMHEIWCPSDILQTPSAKVMQSCSHPVMQQCPRCLGGKNFLLTLLLIWVIGLFLPLGGAPSPEEMEIPVESQVPLFLKILTFDRNLKSRVGDEIVLGIVYQEKFRTSLNVKDQVEGYLKGLTETKIDEVPFRWVCIPLGSPGDLKTILEKEKVDVVYISPLRAVEVESLVAVTRSLGITSMSGVPGYCPMGIAISIGAKRGNPLITINLSAAQAEGIDFSSRLLKLAKVIDNRKK